MADNQIDILIKFGLDPAKAREAVGEIKKLEQTTTSAGKESVKAFGEGAKATDDSTKKIQGLNRAMNLLERQFGAAGNLLKFALSPGALGISALAISIGLVKQALADWNAELAAIETAAAQALGPTGQDMREIADAANAANEGFKKFQKSIGDQSSNSIENINAITQAILKLAAVEEKVALARATDDKEAASIKARFAFTKEEIDLRGQLLVISQKEAELQTKRAALGEESNRAADLLGGRSEGEAKQRAAMLDKQIAAADANAASAQGRREAEDFTGQGPLAGFWRNVFASDPQTKAIQQKIIDELEGEEIAARDYARGLRREKSTLSGGLTAAGNAATLATDTEKLQGEIGRLKLGTAGNFVPGGEGFDRAIGAFNSGGGSEASVRHEMALLMQELQVANENRRELFILLHAAVKDGELSRDEIAQIKTRLNVQSQRH